MASFSTSSPSFETIEPCPLFPLKGHSEICLCEPAGLQLIRAEVASFPRFAPVPTQANQFAAN